MLYGRSREEVTGDCTKFHEDKRKFCFASGVVRVVRSRRRREWKKETLMSQIKNAYSVLVRKHEGTKLAARYY